MIWDAMSCRGVAGLRFIPPNTTMYLVRVILLMDDLTHYCVAHGRLRPYCVPRGWRNPYCVARGWLNPYLLKEGRKYFI